MENKTLIKILTQIDEEKIKEIKKAVSLLEGVDGVEISSGVIKYDLNEWASDYDVMVKILNLVEEMGVDCEPLFDNEVIASQEETVVTEENSMQHHGEGCDCHGHEHHHQRHHRGDRRGDGLGDHLPQGVDVAGVAGHDIACGVGVKIAQRQLLHLGKQLVADGLLNALGHAHHQIALEEGGHHAHHEDAGKLYDKVKQGLEIRAPLRHHGQDEPVNQLAQSRGAGGLGNGVEQDAHQHQGQHACVILQIAQYPQEGILGIFCLAAVAAHFCRRHYSSPPFC